MDVTRSNLAVPAELDQSVRMYIAAQGGGRKGDLSKFIVDAIRSYLFERAVSQAKTAASGIPDSELDDLIDEAVEWARAPAA